MAGGYSNFDIVSDFGFEFRYWQGKSSIFDQVKVYFDVAVGESYKQGILQTC